MRRSRASALAVVLAACGGAPARREAPRCDPEARLVLAGQDDVFAAAGCLTVQSLTVRSGAPLDLSALAKLHVIFGELRLGPTVGLDELRLPELHSAGTIAVASNHDLHGIFLPKLTTAGSIAIENNIALTTISMPALANVRETLAIRENGDLELVEMSSLATIGGELHVADNPDLALLELGALERAGAVKLEGNPALDTNIAEAVRSKAAP